MSFTPRDDPSQADLELASPDGQSCDVRGLHRF